MRKLLSASIILLPFLSIAETKANYIFDATKASCLKPQYEHMLSEYANETQFIDIKPDDTFTGSSYDDGNIFEEQIIKKYCVESDTCVGQANLRVNTRSSQYMYSVKDLTCYNNRYLPFKAVGKIKECTQKEFEWDIIHNGEPRIRKEDGVCLKGAKRKDFDLESSLINRKFDIMLESVEATEDIELLNVLKTLIGKKVQIQARGIFSDYGPSITHNDVFPIDAVDSALIIKDLNGKILFERYSFE